MRGVIGEWPELSLFFLKLARGGGLSGENTFAIGIMRTGWMLFGRMSVRPPSGKSVEQFQ